MGSDGDGNGDVLLVHPADFSQPEWRQRRLAAAAGSRDQLQSVGDLWFYEKA